MPGHVQDIVDSSNDPEVPVLVAARAVAGQITSFEFAPVLFLVAFPVAINRPQHRGPRLPDDQFPADIAPDFLSLFVDDRRIHTEEWQRRTAGFCRNRSG